MKTSLRDSLLKTLRYAQFFDFPLSFDELHLRLITNHLVSPQKLKQSLSHSRLPTSLRKFHTPLFSSKPSPKRLSRHSISQNKIKKAQQVAHFLSHIPSINLVALTGSLAVNNAKSSHDIDLMIITTPHTLWLTRLFTIPLVSFFYNRRRPLQLNHTKDSICLNLWLDSLALTTPPPRQNLYTAHEVLQVKPLFNRRQTYAQFIKANSWTKSFLANAYQHQSQPVPQTHPSLFTLAFAPANLFAFILQYLYMKPKITRETVTLHSAYFHPNDYFSPIHQYLSQPVV